MQKPPMPPMPPMPAAAPAMVEENVTMTINRSDFDRIHGMVKDLAAALDEFAATESSMGAEMPEMETPLGEDADLAAFAQELNTRSKV